MYVLLFSSFFFFLTNIIVSHCSETLTGIQTIRAFDAQEMFIMENNKKIDGASKSSFMKTCVQRWFNMRMQMLGAVLVFCSTT